MISVVGVYADPKSAREASQRLRAIDIQEERSVTVLPGQHETNPELGRVPQADTDQPGMGKLFGSVVGGAMGAGAGIGATALLLPGVGPVTVIGLLGMGLLGAAGAVAGAKLGDSIEESFDEGLPIDELFFYEDALHKGRSVVIALARDHDEAERVREIFEQSGAESVDAARQGFWLGLRSAEEHEYTTGGGDWTQDESTYRAGFEAAFHPGAHGFSYKEAAGFLQRRYPELYAKEAFKRGYERGRAFRASKIDRQSTAAR